MDQLNHGHDDLDSSDLKPSKPIQLRKFEVVVTQFNCFSKKFVVKSTSERGAQEIVRDMVNDHPVDARKGTYDGTDLVLVARENPQAEQVPKKWFEPTGLAICTQKTMREVVTPTEMVLQKSMGNVLKRLRENMKLSQREFAIKANLTQPLIGVYERGETGIRLYNFITLAATLGKHPDDFIRAVGIEYEQMLAQGISGEDRSHEPKPI